MGDDTLRTRGRVPRGTALRPSQTGHRWSDAFRDAAAL